MVKPASEFTILPKNNSFIKLFSEGYSTNLGVSGERSDPGAFYPEHVNANNSTSYNLFSYTEIEAPRSTSYSMDRGNSPTFSSDDEKLRNLDILEISMWQMRIRYSDESLVHFDNVVASSISGMESPVIRTEDGTYEVNEPFLRISSTYATYSDILQGHVNIEEIHAIEMDPLIGIRC